MVSDESVVDQETSERLLDFSERPELKRLLDQYDVVKVEVRILNGILLFSMWENLLLLLYYDYPIEDDNICQWYIYSSAI